MSFHGLVSETWPSDAMVVLDGLEERRDDGVASTRMQKLNQILDVVGIGSLMGNAGGSQ